MKVTVVHQEANGRIWQAQLDLEPGTPLLVAVQRSGLPAAVCALAVDGRVGVFGRLRPLDWPLQEGDRVEIYRPLRVDPKQRRRERALAAGRRP